MIPRSSRLLAALIEAREFTADELACHLLVPIEAMPRYLAGTMVMPLSRQMLLAKFVIDRSATLKRAGHALHAQAAAAIGFHAQKTISHTGPRQSWTGRRRR